MDAYKAYFGYAMRCVCGIPKITVTGTSEDWQRIRARVEVFEAYGLGWWVQRLRPILDEFIATVNGQPCRDFWQAIYKPKQAYGLKTITGWIADLFPYLGDAPKRTRNNAFRYERRDWAMPVEQGLKSSGLGEPGAEKGAAGFPSGLSSVPVHLDLPDGRTAELDLVAGFLAVEQNRRDLAISPVISWSVAERAPENPMLISR